MDLLETIRQSLRRSGKPSNARPASRPSPSTARRAASEDNKDNGPAAKETKGGKNGPAEERKG